MKKLLLLWAILLASGLFAFAQQTKVTGRVTSAASGAPAEGISVMIKGTKKGTLTNLNGEFSLSTPNGSTLVLSGVGFVAKEITASDIPFEVVLEVVDNNLADVVVVGYGSQKRSNLTSAVSTVKGEQLLRRPVSSASMSLQGMVAGVTVRQGSGQPGADGGTINIRGVGSINNSSTPLIVVDGVEGVSLNDIDPNIIESISILKDAASTAVYGVRATNGVILVKTKRGQNGKTSVAFNSFLTLQQPTNMPKTLSAVDNMILNNELVSNTGSTQLPYSQATIDLYRNTAPNNFTVFDTDWQDLVFQNTGLMQNHNLIISGGSDKASFLASGTYLNQQGLILNNAFTKYDLRINGDVNITKRIKFTSDIFYTKATNMVPAGMAPTQIIQRAITMAKNFPGKFEAGKYGDAGQSNSINPIGMAEASNTQTTETPTLSLRFALKAEIIKNLFLEIAYNNRSSYTQTVRPGKTYDVYTPNPATSSLIYSAPIGDSSITYSNSRFLSNQYFASLNYNFMVNDDHVVKVQGGFQAVDNTTESMSATRFGLQYPDRPYLNLATGQQQPQVGGGATDNAVAGFFGRLNYSFRNTYLLEVTGRYDGTSRFSQAFEKQSGFFPGASAGWIISNENFFKNVKAINFAKLRASYGALGNQEVGANYPFTSTLDAGTAYYYNNVLTRGFSLNNVQNVSLGWETSTQMDIGIDLGLLNNKLTITADYYEKKVNDMIINVPNPLYVGFVSNVSSIPTNAGSMINKGWEFSATWRDKIGKFGYSITGNLADVTNKVLDTKGQDIVTSAGLIAREGFPINSYNLYTANGLYQTGDDFNVPTNGTRLTAAGDVKYVDINKDGVLNAGDRQLMGNNFPRYEWSTDLNLSYGSFDLSTFIYGVGKRDNYISGVGVEPFNAGNWIASGLEPILDRWTPQNPGAKYPRLHSGGNGNYVSSTYWLRNGAFWRIKHITLGYNLAKNMLEKVKLQQFRVYVSVVNAFTKSNYEPGFDPEISNTNGAFYPIMRTMTAGINIRF
jgi:TonB-linked SusC/RagA family outer membrane protein